MVRSSRRHGGSSTTLDSRLGRFDDQDAMVLRAVKRPEL
jgi:hypothetical protein